MKNTDQIMRTTRCRGFPVQHPEDWGQIRPSSVQMSGSTCAHPAKARRDAGGYFLVFWPVTETSRRFYVDDSPCGTERERILDMTTRAYERAKAWAGSVLSFVPGSCPWKKA